MFKEKLSKILSISNEDIHIIIKFCGIKVKIAKTSNNKIILIKNNKEKKINRSIKGLKIKIKGKNNTIKIEAPIKFSNSSITIQGNNNNVFIHKSDNIITNLTIAMTCNVDNRSLIINKDFSCVSANIILGDDNSRVEIGEDCMLSAGVQIFGSDLHTIIDNNSGKVLNNSSHVSIGKHCWLGVNALFKKNAMISDNSIVGANSVVTKKFKNSNIIIAGNPAVMIKENINWNRKNSSLFYRDISNQ